MPQAINPETRTLSFEGLTHECIFCEDGLSRLHAKKCPTCGGKGTVPNGKRNRRCSECKGQCHVSCEPYVVGICVNCNGTRQEPTTAYDNMTDADKEWIFENLFNFDKPYAQPASSFNEGYLGIGIVCGVTDYGRYQKMSPEEFREEVKKNFFDHYCQYVAICDKQMSLPKEILIRKTSSGWFAYPIY